MDTTKPVDIDVLSLAMLGAWHSGECHAVHDTKPGVSFRGAMAAADSIGLTDAKATVDSDVKHCRSMFISGYLHRLKETHPWGVPTNDGVVVGVGQAG